MNTLLKNPFYYHGVGLIVLTALLFLLVPSSINENVLNSLIIVYIGYGVVAVSLPKISQFLLRNEYIYILPILLLVYAAAAIILLFTRMAYSLVILLDAFFISLFWFYLLAGMRSNVKKLHLAVIDNFDHSFLKNKNISYDMIENFKQLPVNGTDAVIVDLHNHLTDEQLHYIAECSLTNYQVIHSDILKEQVYGRVSIQRLAENALGNLKPNPLYQLIKRFWESLFIIMILPMTLLIMAIAALFIKINSPGPIMYKQERIGQGGKIFQIYKLRSMTNVLPQKKKFATQEQSRITTVGRIIRKVRIDELPQLFNVLKGEMSLIGPRPEQKAFVDKFLTEIPFYNYRHIVKPGISGWAQTVQGYADDTESTKTKLAYDLYYIKHFSFWLDVNIVFKTFRIMLTGFGAR